MKTINMKRTLLILYIIMSPLFVNAQREDSTKQNKDWKFAAGITVYTNNNYVRDEKVLERQPIEPNVRFKFKRHHVLRFQFPFSLKVNISGIPGVESPFLNQVMNGNGENKAYEIWKGMEAGTFNFIRTNQYYYSLFGASLGYDYDYKLKYGFSIFGGFDFSFTHYEINTDHIDIYFTELNEDNQAQLRYLDYLTNKFQENCLSIKPLLGLRYVFQKKILLECSIGKGFAFFNKLNGRQTIQSFDSNDITVLPFWQRRDYKQVITQLSINYLF